MKYMKKKQIVCIFLALAVAFLITGFSYCRKEGEVQKKLAEEVFRFHVIANSDSESDQCLKLKVKEYVIAYLKEAIPESESAEMTKEWASSPLTEIEEVAVRTLRSEGCMDEVTAYVTECYFPDKTYGDLTFP